VPLGRSARIRHYHLRHGRRLPSHAGTGLQQEVSCTVEGNAQEVSCTFDNRAQEVSCTFHDTAQEVNCTFHDTAQEVNCTADVDDIVDCDASLSLRSRSSL
jgi:hypothetical protein